MKDIVRATISILLLLCACSSPTYWSFQEIKTKDPFFTSRALSYHALDKVNEIDLKMLSSADRMRLYLEVHSGPIPPYKGDPSQARVTLTVGGEKTTFLAARRQSGYRLLLPEEVHSLILSTLQANQSLRIELEGYATTIHPKHFSKYYQKMKKPTWSLPFRLPF